MENKVQVIQSILKVELPSCYRAFIERFGYLVKNGYEVYGLSDEMKDIYSIPCVIGATLRYKEAYCIDKDGIVIAHSGVEDFIVVLDTKTCRVYEINSAGSKHLLDLSFDMWISEKFEINI
jgi:hypothetical protein